MDDEESAKAEPSPGYGNGPGYWNARYKEDPEPFEWLEGFSDLSEMLEEISGGDRSIRILHVGCGNSTLPEKMYDDGWKDIVNVDNAGIVVDQMRERNAHRQGMTWLEMDATKMEAFEDRSFDLVIDKSVLDTFACTDNALVTVATYLKEISRCLKNGGTFLCVSYGAPSTRLNFLQMKHLEWSLRQVEMPAKHRVCGGGWQRYGSDSWLLCFLPAVCCSMYETSNPHYAYICRTPEHPQGAAESYEDVLESVSIKWS